MGIRLAKLPPEVPGRTIREALAQYVKVNEVNEDRGPRLIGTQYPTGYA
jgi:hypothetical protein